MSTQLPNGCFDIPYAAPAANLKVQLWYCNGTPSAQGWLSGGGALQSAGPYCLAIASGESVAVGAQVSLQTCPSSGTGMLWQYINGQVQVVGTSLCVAQTGQFGVGLELHTCASADATQAWALGANNGNQVSGIRVRSQVASLCLDSQVPTALRVTACDGTVAQQWFWEAGAVRIAGDCLAAGSSAPKVTTCSGDPAQKWSLQGSAIVNTASGACLTASSTPTFGATVPVIMGACTNSAAQGWVLGGG